MSLSLGDSVNRGLRVIGDPDVASFTSTNQLQNLLIDAANEAVHDLVEAARFRWALFRDQIVTKDDLTTGRVSATNGSTTVTSLDDDNANANNFTNVAAGDFIRIGADLTSYEVSTINTASSPDTLVLADSYVGTTTTGSAYTILKDVYAISIASLDEILYFSYGDSASFTGGDEIKQTSIQHINDLSGGDLHRDTSGTPSWCTQIGVDTSDNPRWLFWPYPKDAYLITAWATLKWTSNTIFATKMFGGDAPDIAYDAVAHKIKERACLYDEDHAQAGYWGQQYERARMQLVAREQRKYREGTNMTVETYRRNTMRTYGINTQSSILFDRVS